MMIRRMCSGVMAGVAVGAIAIVVGCGAARPAKYYQLSVPKDMSANDANPLPVALLLAPLMASHLYRDDRIVYASSGQSMGTYEYQRWVEPPTELIQTVLFRELRASGRYRSVHSMRSNARGDFVLHGRLYDFKEVTGNPLVARMSIEYAWREAKTGTTVWSHYYAHDEPVEGKDVAAVVAALDRNAQGIVGQVKGALEQYFAAHPPAVGATGTPSQ